MFHTKHYYKHLEEDALSDAWNKMTAQQMSYLFHREGLHKSTMAELFNVSTDTVRNKMRQLGVSADIGIEVSRVLQNIFTSTQTQDKDLWYLAELFVGYIDYHHQMMDVTEEQIKNLKELLREKGILK